MLSRIFRKRSSQSDGESPFWISFSDLMSALMVLFLVVMAVTLVAITDSLDAATKANVERATAINKIMAMIAADPRSVAAGVGVDQKNYRIDLGKEVRFGFNSAVISEPAEQFLRAFTPVLLKVKDTPEGRRWIRSVVVEGYTDEQGDYLPNLKLSLERSRSVVCALFKPSSDGEGLTDEQLRKVQELFLVGGYSFNSIKKDPAESRRVEFKIDFWGADEKSPAVNERTKDKGFGRCV